MLCVTTIPYYNFITILLLLQFNILLNKRCNENRHKCELPTLELYLTDTVAIFFAIPVANFIYFMCFCLREKRVQRNEINVNYKEIFKKRFM